MEAPKYCPRCKNPKWDVARKVGETRGRKPGGGVVMASVKELAAVRHGNGKSLNVARPEGKPQVAALEAKAKALRIPGVKMGSELKAKKVEHDWENCRIYACYVCKEMGKK